MHAENLAEYILKASGLPDTQIANITQGSHSSLQDSVSRLQLDTTARGDHYGLLSISATSLKQRRAFYSCLPFSGDYQNLQLFIPWLDAFASCQYRPLRIAGTLASLYLVERILRTEISNQDDPSDETKRGLSFCGTVTLRILYPRTRDTCAVIRHGVCDAILKWCEINPEVLSSSLFNNRSGNIIGVLSQFILDDDCDIRALVVTGLQKLYQNENVPSRTVSKIINETSQIILNSIISKAQELHELIETGNPPYIALLHSEIQSSAYLIRDMVSRSPTILDHFESAGKDNFDLLFQLTFDPTIPVHIRTCIAHIVSSHVLGADVISRSFRDTKRAVEMLIAFIYQFTPFVGSEHQIDYRSVFESFCSEMDSSTLSEFVNEGVGQVTLGQHPLQKIWLYVQLIETCCSIVKRNNFRNSCSINVSGMFSLLHLFVNDTTSGNDTNSSLIYMLNAISLIIQTIEPNKLMSAQEVAEATSALAHIVDPQTDRPYQQLYLAYTVWSQLAESNEDVMIRLGDWGSSIDRHLTVETLKNVHALESSTPRDLADLPAMEKLLDFVEKGDIPSIAAMCCAIDIVVIQLLKKNSSDQLFRLDALRTRLRGLLANLSCQAAESDARDQSARVIRFFCQYRMVLLGELTVAPKLTREKGNIIVNSNKASSIGLKLNEYIISELIEKERVDIKLIELQDAICSEVRE